MDAIWSAEADLAAAGSSDVTSVATDVVPRGTAAHNAIAQLAELADRPFIRYNLGNSAGYSMRQGIEVARRITGQPIPAQNLAGGRSIPSASASRERLAHPNGYSDWSE